MTDKERILASYFLNSSSEIYGNFVCNDVNDSIFDDWTIEERRKFVKEFHDWNGDPEEYNENFLHIPDYSIMGFLAYKIGSKKQIRKDKLNKLNDK